jgi:two-component system NtrC family sensor kinase
MRHILIGLAFIFIYRQPTFAQNKIVDSLKTMAASAASDSTRVLLLIDLASLYQFYNSDSALLIISEATKLSDKIDHRRGSLRALARYGEIRHLRGELPLALEAELSVIQQSEKYNYPDIEAEGLTFLATIYLDLAEYRQAYTYLFRAKKIYDNIDVKSLFGGAQQIAPYTLSNIGYTYEKLKMLDSAMFYYKAVFAYPIHFDDQQRTDILIRTAIVERHKQHYPDAFTHLWEALSLTHISNDLLNRSVTLNEIALLHKEQKNIDSSLYYAFLAYKAGEESSYKTAVLEASNLLATLYKTRGNPDSAFYYQQMAINTKDSLFGLDKFHKLQLLTLSEQQRLQQLKEEQVLSKNRMRQVSLLFFVGIFLLIAFVLWRLNRQQKKANYLLNEKNLQIEKQSDNLKKALSELKSTQAQLIQSEKMASLGQLTAGIAHEIQNPLNFVNNFSEVNSELIDELSEEVKKGNLDEVQTIAKGIKENEQKINHHGKRADAIVKGMLQHSQTSSGTSEPTDINALADEYLRLAYQGFKAKDKLFNATLQTNFDESIGKINVIPQDIGRVLLNLYNNAFYAVNERQKAENLRPKAEGSIYEPTVTVTTKNNGDKLEIKVVDNGNGISQKIVDKIFQPFFTTKPTGQGTGLGLSLAYDIIKAHGGEIKVETKDGEGSKFIIQLPRSA